VSANQSKGFSDNLTAGGTNDMPLGVGELGDDISLDPLAGTGTRRKFNGGSLVLIGVIAMAFAGLFFMRTLSKVSAADGGKNSMEDKVKKFLETRPKAGSNDPTIVFDIGGSYTERQIPLDNLQRNPFIIFDDVPLPENTGPVTDKNAAKRLADRRMQFQKAYDKLALKSIIMSSNPMASVSNKIVRRGDEISIDPEGVTFRVIEITADNVSLVAEDVEFNLIENYTLTLKRDY
jgi:hypothetical protein